MAFTRAYCSGFVLCCCVAGCTDSGLVNTVAEKAARVATLEIELRAARDAAEAARLEVNRISGTLADAEAKLRTTEALATKAEQQNREMSMRLSALQQKADSVGGQLASAQSQLDRIAAEQRQQLVRMAIVGKWETPPRYKGDPLERSSFEFRHDGSGVWTQGVVSGNRSGRIDYRISWSQTRMPGVYEIHGTTVERESTAPREDPKPVKGIFRVQPDGGTGELDSWDTETAPRQYLKNASHSAP